MNFKWKLFRNSESQSEDDTLPISQLKEAFGLYTHEQDDIRDLNVDNPTTDDIINLTGDEAVAPTVDDISTVNGE